jgi:hypothetical protein
MFILALVSKLTFTCTSKLNTIPNYLLTCMGKRTLVTVFAFTDFEPNALGFRRGIHITISTSKKLVDSYTILVQNEFRWQRRIIRFRNDPIA